MRVTSPVEALAALPGLAEPLVVELASLEATAMSPGE